MTTRILALSAVLASTLVLPARSADPDAPTSTAMRGDASLIVQITGLEDLEGELLIGLYNSEAGFESENDLVGRTVPVDARTESVTFRGIPAGDYAIKVFHDEDSDGKLDTTFGIPSEPYGFSNNASDPFSAPEWEETKFRVEGTTSHAIDLG